MNIDLGDFIIKHCEAGIEKFDLFAVKTVKSGKTAGNKIEVSHAYGVNFERCIRVVIQERANNEINTDDLEAALTKYQEITKNTLNQLKDILKG